VPFAVNFCTVMFDVLVAGTPPLPPPPGDTITHCEEVPSLT
jgi:hypothetical protein